MNKKKKNIIIASILFIAVIIIIILLFKGCNGINDNKKDLNNYEQTEQTLKQDSDIKQDVKNDNVQKDDTKSGIKDDADWSDNMNNNHKKISSKSKEPSITIIENKDNSNNESVLNDTKSDAAKDLSKSNSNTSNSSSSGNSNNAGSNSNNTSNSSNTGTNNSNNGSGSNNSNANAGNNNNQSINKIHTKDEIIFDGYKSISATDTATLVYENSKKNRNVFIEYSLYHSNGDFVATTGKIAPGKTGEINLNGEQQEEIYVVVATAYDKNDNQITSVKSPLNINIE